MTKRRRRVKIMGSSVRLFAFILFGPSLILLFEQQCNILPPVGAHWAPSGKWAAGQQQLEEAALVESGAPSWLAGEQAGQWASIKQQQQQQQQQPIQSSQQQQQQHEQNFNNNNQQQHNNNNQQQHHHRHSLGQLCSSLGGQQARQLKLCKLIGQSANAEEALAVGVARGLAECRQQFRQDRWNCTHAGGEHRLLTGKLGQSAGNRESAYVQAIAAAGIVHSIATACSQGALADCACDKSRVGLIRQKDQIWKWGGCSNNIRHGMLFAKHLVELLDQAHQHQHLHQHHQHHHQHQQQQQHQQGHSTRHNKRPPAAPSRKRRALAAAEQQRVGATGAASGAGWQRLAANPAAHSEAPLCQNRSQNISQAAHLQLVRSLLARNSLEKHQEFRLAMNMHNNKIGRMAVAKNMEIKCRCHGLSGSCSLKTCWLKLPDFQQIGTYLRRKYEVSIHLPSAVNVNKLIPMMDRHEISTILQQTSNPSPQAPPDQLEQQTAVWQTGGGSGSPQLAAGQHEFNGGALSNALAVAPGGHFNFYERHKQLAAGGQQQQQLANVLVEQPQQQTIHREQEQEQLEDEAELVGRTISISPMSQQQYQTLLRELKLCSNSSSSNNNNNASQMHQPNYLLTTRDLNQMTMGKNGQHNNYAKKHLSNSLHGQQTNPRGGLNAASHQLNQLLHNTNSKEDLIHLHKSPDYCQADLNSIGFAGVQSRSCNAHDPQAPDSCDKLCCGRGYVTRESQLRYNCDCKFQYCCKIHCNYCHKKLVEYVCK